MALIKKAGTTRNIGGAQPAPSPQSEAAPSGSPAAPSGSGDDTRIYRSASATPTDDGTRIYPPEPAVPPARPADADSTRRISAAASMQPGVILQGRYQIEGTHGIGGMSVVYRGRDLRFRDVVRYCAIKEMFQSAPDSHTRLLNLKNFEREAGLLATLNHPAIPKIYDFFEENGRIYLILELIGGDDLENVLEAAHGPLEPDRVARWVTQICDVLTYLHSREPEVVVFRDLKPSNIILTPDDRIVLIDFGIARNLDRERKGTMIGTEGYSPPEQYRGMAEPRGDIYALGATMHQLLTNADPRLETPFTFHQRPIRATNPRVSPALEAVINRALEYDVAARWESAEAMKQALLGTPELAGVAVAPVAQPARVPVAVRQSTSAELVWKFRCEDEIRSSPCVGHSMVYAGCYDTNLYAIDAQRGEFRWKFATEGGISSSPALWSDTVLIGSEDGVLYAIDARRGASRWTFRTAKPIRSSPRVEERMVFIGSDDQHFYAIDGLRGNVIWKYRTWMPIRSSACITDTNVYVGGDDGQVYALDALNGSLRWKQKTQQPIRSTPAFAEGLVLVGGTDSTFYALDAEGGWPAWKFRTGHVINASPCVLGSRVFVGSVDGTLYALEIKNGRLAWKYETGSQITSSPRAEQGRIYFGAVDQSIYCLDASSGALIWRHQTNGPVVSSPCLHEGIVYIGSMDHHIYALKA